MKHQSPPLRPPIEDESAPPENPRRGERNSLTTRSTDKGHTGRWSAVDWLALAGITLIGGLLRLYRVADPREFIFDEVYYAKDACMYVLDSLQACKLEDVQNQVHPPLGKWLIAGGIEIFGFNSLGYRIALVLAGAITIALLYLLARKILRSTLGAALAAGLLVIDPLHFVQSRTSMLDVFVPMFAVAAFLFLVYDRDNLLRRGEARARPRGFVLGRPWRLAAGLAAGAAFATKWSGAFVIVAVVVLSLGWEIAARRPRGFRHALGRTFTDELPTVLLWCLVVPLAFYVVSYTGVDDVTGLAEQPRNLEGEVLTLPTSDGSWWQALWEEQKFNWKFHTQDLKESSHPYQSPGWSWILLKRPVSYFYESPDAEGNLREILATGSPFVWWSSIGAIGYVIFQWLRRSRLGRPEGVILAGIAFTYGPWLLPMDRPTVFLFYFVVTVPFLCLALAYVAVRIGKSWEARAAIGVFSLIALGFFAFYYPLLTKGPLTQPDWEKRLLFFDDCTKPPGKEVTTTVTETIDGKTTASPSVSNTNEDIPPTGWCWI